MYNEGMSEENISNLILERLYRIDKKLEKLDSLEQDMAMVKDSLAKTHMHLTHMDSYMAGFYSNLRYPGVEIDELKARVEFLGKPQESSPPSDHKS